VLTLATDVHLLFDKDGAAILDARHDAITTLNPMGALIWRKLERGDSVELIIEELSLQTGMECADVRVDLMDFIGDLKSKHLVTGVTE
jgi:hypothetical protein